MPERKKQFVIWGYGRHAVDEQTLALIDVSFGELDQTTQAKSVYRIFDCKVTGEDQVTSRENEY